MLDTPTGSADTAVNADDRAALLEADCLDLRNRTEARDQRIRLLGRQCGSSTPTPSKTSRRCRRSAAYPANQIYKPMKRRPWINQYGTVAILVMLLLVMNPELRVFLLLTNFIGLDLMIFFIAIQLRYLLPAVPSIQHPMRTFLCVASYTTLRFATRVIALLLAPADRATAGLTTLLFVLSKNMWCPTLKPDFRPI